MASIETVGEGFGSLVLQSGSDIIFRVAKNAQAAARRAKEERFLSRLGGSIGRFQTPLPLFDVRRSAYFPFGVSCYKKLPGIPLQPEHLTSLNREHIAQSIAELAIAIHALDKNHFDFLPRWLPSKAERMLMWGRVSAFLQAQLLPLQCQKLAAWHTRIESELAKAESDSVIVHGDLWYENLLVDPCTYDVIAAIDFEEVGLGSPDIDLAPQSYLGAEVQADINFCYQTLSGHVLKPESNRANAILGHGEVRSLSEQILRGQIDDDAIGKICALASTNA